MNLNSRVIFNNPQFIVSNPQSRCLRVKAGFQSEDILITIFTLLGLAVFWFVNIVFMDHNAPYEFLQWWRFRVAFVIVLLILYYVWYKGYVQFNNIKKIVTIKRNQNKFFGAVRIPYDDISGIHVDISERINRSNKKYFVYLFSLKLKSGGTQKFLKVFRKKQGRRIKIAIAEHLDRAISESYN